MRNFFLVLLFVLALVASGYAESYFQEIDQQTRSEFEQMRDYQLGK